MSLNSVRLDSPRRDGMRQPKALDGLEYLGGVCGALFLSLTQQCITLMRRETSADMSSHPVIKGFLGDVHAIVLLRLPMQFFQNRLCRQCPLRETLKLTSIQPRTHVEAPSRRG